MMIDYTRLAQEYGTPLYVYDATKIRSQYQKLKSLFNAKILYAMKANYNPDILKTLLDEGASIDAVSIGDVTLAQEVGFAKENILFTANRTTEEELEAVYNKGILCNIGSLSQLNKFGQRHKGAEVCIRLNPMIRAGENEQVITAGEDSKFGIPLTKKGELLDIIGQYELKVIGVHEHTGSGIPETVKMKEGMENILALLNQEDFPHLRFVDFGGGFKVPYKGEEEIDYSQFAQEVNVRFEEFCEEYGRELDMYFEPGKYLVAQSGTLIVTVTDITRTPNKTLVGVNSGFPQLIRPMFYGAYHKIDNLTNPQGELQKYDVVGNICESGDSFATDRTLPEVREGELLAIRTAGAYCYSMGGFYNLRPMPTEMLVDGNELIVRKASTTQELVESVLNAR